MALSKSASPMGTLLPSSTPRGGPKRRVGRCCFIDCTETKTHAHTHTYTHIHTHTYTQREKERKKEREKEEKEKRGI